MRTKSAIPLTLAFILIVPLSLLASGFGYYEHGAKATAMAGAFVARADDASAIYYNPAGIAFLEGSHISFQMHPVKPSFTAIFMGQRIEGTTPWLPPLSGFFTTKISDRLAVGFGMFLPAALETRWPEDWLGNQVSYKTSLKSFYFQPTVAYKVSDRFSIGLGLDYVWSKVALYSKVNFAPSPLLPISVNIDSQLEGCGSGYGFNLGALFRVHPKAQIGIKYQSQVDIDYEGDVAFAYSATGIPLIDGVLGAVFTDQTATTSISMPSELVVGVMFKPADKFTAEIDVQWTGWSCYDRLTIVLQNPLLGMEDINNWDDSWMFRLGGEYMLSDAFALRAGYIYDTSPAADNVVKPLLPDADRNEITAGFGYSAEGWAVDFAIQQIWFEDRTSTWPAFPASYESNALIIGIGLSYHF